jgi:DNA polymerase (family 10)
MAVANTVVQRFTTYAEVAEILSAGTTRASVILKCGSQVDLRAVKKESYGAALHLFYRFQSP